MKRSYLSLRQYLLFGTAALVLVAVSAAVTPRLAHAQATQSGGWAIGGEGSVTVYINLLSSFSTRTLLVTVCSPNVSVGVSKTVGPATFGLFSVAAGSCTTASTDMPETGFIHVNGPGETTGTYSISTVP